MEHFGVPIEPAHDNGYVADDEWFATLEQAKDWIEYVYTIECPRHGTQAITGDESLPSMVGHGSDATTMLACGCCLVSNPITPAAWKHADGTWSNVEVG